MKSVGEAMAIGRTFQESFQKVHPRAHACGVSLCRRGSLLMSVTPNDEAERLSKIAREHALFVTQTAAVHLSQGQQCIAKLAAQTARQCILVKQCAATGSCPGLAMPPDADARPAQALRSQETGLDGWSLPKNWKRMTRQQLEYGLRVPNPERMVVLKQVLQPPQGAC